MAMSIPLLVRRLTKKAEGLKPASPEMAAALGVIGSLVRARAIINIRTKKIIDLSHLLNSINYKLFSQGTKDGVAVGSFGIPYAAVHEFGFKGHVFVRSFTRTRNGVRENVRPHERFMNIRARPYLRPAVIDSKNDILTILRRVAGA